MCHKELCHQLRVENGEVVAENVAELTTDHEEADTRLILHANHAASNYKDIAIRSPDTDVLVLCSAFAQEMMFCPACYA